MWGEPISEHRARMALEGAFGQLDQGWLILVDLRLNGPADATDADYVLLHPGCGIALIDVILSRTGDPARRLREFLENEGFSQEFPGTLPIVRLVLKPTETTSFRRRLDSAFAEGPPIAIANPDWVAALNDLLVPAAPSAPQEGPRGALWDVLPTRWPDQVAEATPLRRSHKSRPVQARTKSLKHAVTKYAGEALLYTRESEAPPQDMARPPEDLPPRVFESFSARREGPEAIDPAASPRQRAENAIEGGAALPSAITPMIGQVARWRNRVAGKPRSAVRSSYRIMSDAAVGARRAARREIPSLLFEASGRRRVRAAAACLLAAMLGGGAVFLAVAPTPGNTPGEQIPTADTDATASAASEAAAETGSAVGASTPSPEPRSAPEPSFAALSVPTPVVSSPISVSPPWPRVKPSPPAAGASPAVPAAKPIPGIEKVGVVTGIHDGFGRIVFAWPQAVKYQTHLEDQSLTISFARPLAADVARIAKELPLYVEGATMDGESSVVITLKRPLEIVTMLNRNRVAIDLLDRPAADATPLPSVPVTVVDEGGVRRLIFAWPEPVEFTATVAKGEAKVRFNRAGTIDLQPLVAAAPDLAPRVSGGKSDVQLLLTLPIGSRLKAYHKDTFVIVDVTPGKRTKPGASSPQSTRTAWTLARPSGRR